MTKEEALTYLTNFITTKNTQDNRGTADPYYFVIQERCKHPVLEGDDYDVKEEHFTDAVQELFFKYHWEDRAFAFTLKGAEEHLRLNKHNYSTTRIYVKHNFRVPEIEELFEAISAVCDAKLNRR